MNVARLLILAALPLLLAGCLERVAAPGSGQADNGGWQLAGEFGGDAVVSTPSDDPLEVRYAPGGFALISGLDVTDDEVWVCDTDISRIQIFDYSGKLVRTIGSGVDAAAALPSDEQNYTEATTFDHKVDTRWEELHGAPWTGSYRTHFRGADIVVRPDGYWLADLTRTSALRDPLRMPQVLFVPNEGDIVLLNASRLIWPTYIAATTDQVCAADNRANNLVLARLDTDPIHLSYLQRGGTFDKLMALEVMFSDNAQYMSQHFRFTEGSAATGSTYLPGGQAFAFGKLAICDTLNRRIELFEARTAVANWGKAIRIINAADSKGETRFEVPLDIEIADDGTVYVCDSAAAEIVVLDPEFRRLASFGGGTLLEPHALALSPDGRHCFVTDRRNNKVYHYAHGE